MRARSISGALLAGALIGMAGCGSSSPATTDTTAGSSGSSAGASSTLTAIGAGVQGPRGSKATIYAQGPTTTASFALDRQGRLWLAAAGLETHRHDGVYLLARAGAKAVKVISGLDDPLGMLWRGNTLYVASVGRVDEYSGFDGRRFAAHHEILSGPVAGGENNFLAMAPNGRLVMGVTATCDHCKPASRYSGSIVSFKPDGSELGIYASGIRAPVGLAFLPGTSDLLASMNQRDDLGSRTPGDWLALVSEGEDWRFPGCYGQGGTACAGVPEPTAILDRHAAVGQIAVVSDSPGAGSSVLVTEWSSSKVQRVALKRTGSTYSGSVSSFLTGIGNPLAIIQARGGSLLVGDWTTGTIYRIASASS